MAYLVGSNVRVGIAINSPPLKWDSSMNSDPAADIALEARLIRIRAMRKPQPRVLVMTREVWATVTATYLLKWNWFFGFSIFKKSGW